MISQEQVCVIYAGVRGFLDKMATKNISKFETLFLAYLKSNHADLLSDIGKTGVLTKEQDERLATMLPSFIENAGLLSK